jgi:hypothetical protein
MEMVFGVVVGYRQHSRFWVQNVRILVKPCYAYGAVG